MFPKQNSLPGIIIEVKWDTDLDDKALDKLATKALEQIDNKNYEAEMRDDGITDIIKFGMAFSGKHVLIKTR
ncbi:PD-(D/E)XK nuclease superfamily protein [Butyrivibrio sp. INlla18]|nr:PD-(D/E)XK nuclease superfamily protein [Butyrivibrio sp. INlla18]